MSFGVWISGVKYKIKHSQSLSGLMNIYKRLSSFNPKGGVLCSPNTRFKGVYQGKRCFILCNGPSVNKQDLLPLKNEIVFSVSNGYHYKDYLTIQPRFHCVPKAPCKKYFTLDKAMDWLNQMDKGLGSAELFLDVAEERLIREKRLFPGRKINYLYTGTVFSAKSAKPIDISKITLSPQSVPIMCLMIAMYMGFKNIYLIGADHDSCVTGEYKYFYGTKGIPGKEAFVSSDGKIKNLEVERQATDDLMVQYNIIKRVAENQGITIYNATLGGALEVFPRVNFEEVLGVKNG